MSSPNQKWVPLEDDPFGPEGSQLFGCALRIWILNDTAIGWSCIEPSGERHSGHAASRTIARIEAESKAAKLHADRQLEIEGTGEPERELLPVFLIQVDPNDLESLTRAHRMIAGLLAEVS